MSIPWAAFGEIPTWAPNGVYTDKDPAAMHFVIPPGGRAQFRQALNVAIGRNPKDPVLLSHRAYLFQEGGDLALAIRDFNKAIQYAQPGSDIERNISWSIGWAHYDQGDYAGALDNWTHAIKEHGGKPYWEAYTLALLYWTAGNRDLARDWYAAAAASDPEWGNEKGFSEKTRYWRPIQRERMRQLFDLWRSGTSEGKPD